jgi:hypothetical protein
MARPRRESRRLNRRGAAATGFRRFGKVAARADTYSFRRTSSFGQESFEPVKVAAIANQLAGFQPRVIQKRLVFSDLETNAG